LENGQMDGSKTITVLFGQDQFQFLRAVPVPTLQDLRVSFLSESNKPVQVQVLDLLGNLMLSQDFAAKEGENHLHVSLSSLSPGIYFLRLNREGARSSLHKIVKQ